MIKGDLTMGKIVEDYQNYDFSVVKDEDGKYLLCKGDLKIPEMGKFDTKEEAESIKNHLNELKVE